MAVPAAPGSGACLGPAYVFQVEASPLTAGWKLRRAFAGELINEGDLAPIRVTEHMRANLAIAVFLDTGNLMPIDDGAMESLKVRLCTIPRSLLP